MQFFPNLTREEDRTLRQHIRNLRGNLLAKRVGLPPNSPDVAGDDQFVQPFHDFCAQKMRWHAGEYSMTLTIATDPAKATITRPFRFTLFESDVQALDDLAAQGYKYGNWTIFEPHVGP